VSAGPLPTLDDRAQVAVVISGTVTDRLAPAVAAIVDGCEQQAGRRPTVISFGACASSGGPYWESYAVTKGVDQLVAVDLYVPGCPPPPDALSAVLDDLVGGVKL
jgi:NADH-quinone oxidoreductase subunit B